VGIYQATNMILLIICVLNYTCKKIRHKKPSLGSYQGGFELAWFEDWIGVIEEI
jgi:hypothetical protein